VVIVFMAFALRALWPLTKTPIYLAVTIATIAATMFIFLVSFGVWQHWWIATWFLVAAQLLLALRVLHRTRFTPV